jgi:hypothetical protein
MVLDMEVAKESTLILRRSFLSTARAQIDVGVREIRFNIHGMKKNSPSVPKRSNAP